MWSFLYGGLQVPTFLQNSSHDTAPTPHFILKRIVWLMWCRCYVNCFSERLPLMGHRIFGETRRTDHLQLDSGRNCCELAFFCFGFFCYCVYFVVTCARPSWRQRHAFQSIHDKLPLSWLSSVIMFWLVCTCVCVWMEYLHITSVYLFI